MYTSMNADSTASRESQENAKINRETQKQLQPYERVLRKLLAENEQRQYGLHHVVNQSVVLT